MHTTVPTLQAKFKQDTSLCLRKMWIVHTRPAIHSLTGRVVHIQE